MAWQFDYTDEYRRRIRMMQKLRQRPDLIPGVLAYYRSHPVDWINDWCITFDPRQESGKRMMPFVLFPRQVEMVHFLQGCLADKEPGLIEKARDMGASWVCVAFTCWLWLFHPGSVIGWGSRKEEYVDKKGDLKAILPKVRLQLDNLPGWMMPQGFNMDRDATYMRILNPANGSAVTGEAGDNIGRGGRTTIYFKDESAHYERPESIEAALGDNTDVQIDISSVNGSANVFYRKRHAGVIWSPDGTPERGKTRVFILEWRQHPGKTQEWYDLRKARMENEGLGHIFAQEVDRDYSGSQVRVIIPAEWVRAALDAHEVLGFTPSGKRFAGQDIADGGGDKNALVVRHGVVLIHTSAWGGDAGEAAPIAVDVCRDLGVDELFYDVIGVGAGFKAGANILDQQGRIPRRLTILPWNAGQGPEDPEDHIIPEDRDTPLNEDQYANLKAQAWFRLRMRFYKTWRAVTKGDEFPFEELISIPMDLENRHVLEMELSQAVYKANGSGKTIVDKQPEGSRSPNMADGCVMCFNPVYEPLGFFDL